MSIQRHLVKHGLLPADTRGTDATIHRLLAANDPTLSAWITSAAEALSRAIGMLENLFDPQSTILGGALPDALLDALIARLTLPPGSVSRRAGRTSPRVARGTSGRLSAAMGAAALVIHDTVTPRLDAHRMEISQCP